MSTLQTTILKHPDSASNNIQFDASGRVGIGTTSPGYNLQVSDTNTGNISIASSGNNSGPRVTRLVYSFSDGDGASINATRETSNAAGDVYLSFRTGGITNADEKVRITSSGNVGIGTSSPGNKLEVVGATADIKARSAGNAAANMFLDSNRGAGVIGGQLVSQWNGSAVSAIRFVNGDDAVNKDNGQIAFSTADGGSLIQRMAIDSAGRLLVGTNTASSGRCAVFQGHSAAASGQAIVSFGCDSTAPGSGGVLGSLRFCDGNKNDGAELSVFRDGGTWTSGSSHPSGFAFKVAADGSSSLTERFRIQNLGTIRTYMTGTTGRFHLASDQGAGSTILLNCVNSRTNINSGGVAALRIYTDGDVQNTNNSYTALSDESLKENIVDANSQWDDIKSLRIRNFNFKEETGNLTHTQIGVIAQEVELVSPGLVKTRPAISEEGEASEETLKTVNSSVLYMKAVKALQEALGRIEQLEAKVAALEAG